MTKRKITIKSTAPPTVELDSEAHAAYVRFSKRKVATTQMITCDSALVTVDLAGDGSVVGVELVGVMEFTIKRLLQTAGVSAPEPLLRKARYVPTKRRALAAA